MATTWIKEEGDIPEDKLSFSLSEEKTDGKLSALYYTPSYVNPQDDTDIQTGSEIKVTDPDKLKAYSDAMAANDDTAAYKAMPTLSMKGTYYRAGSGRDVIAEDRIYKFEAQKDKLLAACNNYTGAQREACIRGVAGRLKEMSKAAGFASGGLVEPKPQQDFSMFNKPKAYAEGGSVMPEEQMAMPMEMPTDMSLMEEPMPEMYEEEAASVDSDMVERIASVLSQDEMAILNEALDMHPELVGILDKAMEAVGNTGEFDGEGPVNGPGTETSDSIPARLSDGEFVFTAKAVKQLGVDKLRKMMAKAEDDYDTAMYKQEGNQMEAMGNEEGYFLGGLLDNARKQWGNVQSATAEYQQPMEMTKPTNVDGAGRQMPSGQTGIMQSKTVDLAKQQEANTNVRSAAPAATTGQSLIGTAPDTNNLEQMQQQARLAESAQEDESLMAP